MSCSGKSHLALALKRLPAPVLEQGGVEFGAPSLGICVPSTEELYEFGSPDFVSDVLYPR